MDHLAAYRMTDRDLADGCAYDAPCFLAESELLLSAAAQTGTPIMSMLSTDEFPFPDLPCDQRLVVSQDEFREITGYPQTRSVIGICKRPSSPPLEKLASKAKRLLVIEDSSNGANMATMFRIAYAFGIDGILVTHSCADPLFRRAARMSKGDVLRVPWLRVGSTRAWAHEVMPQLKACGFVTAALALTDDSISLEDLPAPEKLAIIMGTEGEGLQDETIALSDLVVKIPMRAGIDSLNVAAASAVAIWQATRSTLK